MNFTDPNVVPATVALSTLAAGGSSAFLFAGKHYLYLAPSQHVCVEDSDIVTIPNTAQVYPRTVDHVAFV